MFRCDVEYYTTMEPIIMLELKAFTKRGAIKTAYKHVTLVNSYNYGQVAYIQVWFRGRKIFGDGNKVLYLKETKL